MGFRKNSRGADTAETSVAESSGGVAVAEASGKKAKKRKPHDLLSSVVKESTVGAAVALMRDNPRFDLPDGRSWVVLGLRAVDIGGLSMKQKGDEAKGSIIELISADQIHTVATMEMLENETLGIIPSANTLERMGEFSLLKNAPYLWIVMTKTPEGTLAANPVEQTTYADAVEVAEGRAQIAQILPEVWTWAGGEAAGADGGEDAAHTFTAPAEDDPFHEDTGLGEEEGSPFGGEEDPFGAEAEPAGEAPVDYAALAAAEFSVDDDEGVGGADFGEFEKQFAGVVDDEPVPAAVPAFVEAPRTDDRVVDEAEVRSSIARRFLSSDLDLRVDLEAFETNFASGAPVVSFPIDDEATDWLGQQVNLLARQANTEMAQLHRSNIDELRNFWVSLMSRHTEQVISDVSPEREGSYYHRLLAAAKLDLDERRQKGPEEVSAMRQQLVDRYESEAAARGRQAAEQAVARYKDQNRARLEREIAEVGLNNEQASEEFFEGAKQIILETRRRDAEARMDLGMTKVMDVVIERQQAHRDAEEELLRRWSAQMTQFLDENRKNDVARSEALAEELSRSTRIEQLNAEHAAHVDQLRQEQASKIAELDRDRNAVQQAAMEELASRERDWNNQLAAEQQKTDAANTRIQDLLGQFNTHSAALAEQYDGQIKALKADKKSVERQMKQTEKVQSRMNKMLILVVVVMALAALLVGFIVGTTVGASSAAPVGAAGLLLDTAGMLPPV